MYEVYIWWSSSIGLSPAIRDMEVMHLEKREDHLRRVIRMPPHCGASIGPLYFNQTPAKVDSHQTSSYLALLAGPGPQFCEAVYEIAFVWAPAILIWISWNLLLVVHFCLNQYLLKYSYVFDSVKYFRQALPIDFHWHCKGRLPVLLTYQSGPECMKKDWRILKVANTNTSCLVSIRISGKLA